MWPMWFSQEVVSNSCDSVDVAHQAPLSMEFPRREYWSGLPFSSPGDLPDPGIEPRSPALQADSLLTEPTRKALNSAQFWHYLCGNRVQIPQVVLPHTFQMPVTSPGCCLCIWLTNYRSEVPMTYSLGSIMNNLLKQLTELRESCFLDSCFSIKAYNLETSIWKRCIVQGLEKGHGVSMHSYVHQPASSLNAVLLGVCESFIMHAWLLISLAIGSWFNFQFFFPPQRPGVRLKLLNL